MMYANLTKQLFASLVIAIYVSCWPWWHTMIYHDILYTVHHFYFIHYTVESHSAKLLYSRTSITERVPAELDKCSDN